MLFRSSQADDVGLEAVVIADGLGWFRDWYDRTGEASNGVLDQDFRWATAESKAFADAFEDRYGYRPRPEVAGLAFDAANTFIQVAQNVYQSEGELTSETLADFARQQIQTGEWSYTDGIMMGEYLYTLETAPDPVVGEGYYMFPVVQYVDGEGKIVFPPDWADRPFASPGSGRSVLSEWGSETP